MTQHEKIADFIDEFGSITPMEAWEWLNITKLSTRIGEMKRAGFPIVGRMEQETNKSGKTVRFMRYSWDSRR